MADTEVAPPEVHHYESVEEVPWDIQKYWILKNTLIGHASANSSLSYWAQRHRIFSKYDDGVWLTDDAWFGVTPEPVAESVCLSYAFLVLNQ